jgi:hypothetical protein
MLSARPRVAESVLGLGIIVLLAFLIVPWKQRPLPRPPAAGAASSVAPPTALPAAASPASPESILPIFIGRPAASASAPAGKPPLDAPWLQYLGHSSAPDGSVTWYVKDTRSGKIIRASKTEGADGWAVVEEKDTSLLLKNGSDLYTVVKR